MFPIFIGFCVNAIMFKLYMNYRTKKDFNNIKYIGDV